MTVATQRNRRLPQGQQQINALFLLVPIVGQPGVELERLRQMRHRLGESRTRQRHLAGSHPEFDGPRRQPGSEGIVGKHFCRAFGRRRESFENPGVQLFPASLQQTLIGGVPDQSVLERIAAVIFRPLREDQFRVFQL